MTYEGKVMGYESITQSLIFCVF